MKNYQIIDSLIADNSRLAKEAILREQSELNNEEFFQGCRLAIDPMITFGIKQVPEKLEPTGEGLAWSEFMTVARQLVERELTGNAARDRIVELMEQATVAEWNGWYRPILQKDFKAGFSEKIINKVVKPEFKIPVFACQLAEDSANYERLLTGKKRLEVKLDGVRVITIVYPNGRVDQFSRNGKELTNFTVIREGFKKVAKNLNQPVVFDGEVVSKSFQELMRQVHRKSNVQADDSELYLFDAVPLLEFQQGTSPIAQVRRSNWLEDWLIANPIAHVYTMDYAVVDLDTEEGQKLFSQYNKSAVENGFEGIMIKDLEAPYECKRTRSWLKSKPFIEVTLEVENVEVGTGRNKSRMGALVCRGNDSGKEIAVNVGSGFSDGDRDSIWLDRDRVIGQLVEIRADAITQNQDGSYSLRFPRFKCWRGFEIGEKL